MAAIDKTYIKSWDQYVELRDFFTSCGEVTDVYGNKFKPIDYLWKEEDEFKEAIDEAGFNKSLKIIEGLGALIMRLSGVVIRVAVS